MAALPPWDRFPCERLYCDVAALLPCKSRGHIVTAHDVTGFQPRGAAYPPLGMRREVAAWYLGVSPTTFDAWVLAGRMPRGKKVDGIRVWDRRRLDQHFDQLCGEDQDGSPFDDRA